LLPLILGILGPPIVVIEEHNKKLINKEQASNGALKQATVGSLRSLTKRTSRNIVRISSPHSHFLPTSE
jgi:hypothetical protein